MRNRRWRGRCGGGARRKEDDLGAVVRAHIHIEHKLQEVILLAAPKPDQVKFKELDFAAKLHLALVLGLDFRLKAVLNAMGRLRNKFSHRLDMKFGKDEASNLISTLAPQAKQDFHARCKSFSYPGIAYERTQITAFFVETHKALDAEIRRLRLDISQRFIGECLLLEHKKRAALH